jgi:hypothetical protein
LCEARILVQAHLPIVAPLLQAYNFPWLAPAVTSLLSCLPILYTFLAMPILDAALGEEEEAGLPVNTDAWYKPLYRLVCHGFLALHAAVLVTAAQGIAHMSVPMAILTTVNLSILGGFGFCVSHELVHSSHKVDRFLAQVLLTMLCYKQWALSHMCHHAAVATEGDPASAKYRESVRLQISFRLSYSWMPSHRLSGTTTRLQSQLCLFAALIMWH